MEENKIYDLVRLINSHDDIDAALTAAAENLGSILKHRYVSRLYSAVEESQREVQEHPPKEAVLLRALKMYTAGDRANELERIIRIVNMAKTAENINKSFNGIETGGVYALSRSKENICLRSVDTVRTLMLIALLGRL